MTVTLYLLPAAAAPGNYATVFIFHRFGDHRYPSTSVSMKDFEKEMKYLKTHNYNVVSMEKLYEFVSSGKPIPPKTVVITIDDGYKTTMKAFKVLKKYKFPFTVFLYMAAIDRYPDFLTLEQIKEMEKSGLVTFGNHLYNHPNLGWKRLHLSKGKYLKLLQEEEKKSRDRFKKLLGYEPEFLAFPYGDYDKLSLKFFKNGYKLLFSQNRGTFSGREFPVPRMAVVGSQSGFRLFVEDLNIEPLPVVKHTPDIGLTDRNPVSISFEIENPENYRYCSIYATGIGWLNSVEKKGNIVKLKEKLTLVKYKTRIGIRCYDRKTGKKAEFFFLVLEKKPGKSPAPHKN